MEDRCPLYVGGLSFDIDDYLLGEYFSKFGIVLGSTVARDAERRSLGYGFVIFANPEEAEKALAQLNGSKLHDKEIQVNQVTVFKVFVATPGSGTLFLIKHAHPELTEGRRGGRAFSLEAR